MRTIRLRRGKRGVVLVTDAQRPMSEDIKYRQRRYLIMMGIRVVGLILAVFLFHGVARFIAAAVAIVMPYFAVVFANGGREPDSGRRFQPYDPGWNELPTGEGGRADQYGGPQQDYGGWPGRDGNGAGDAGDPRDEDHGRPSSEDSLSGGDGSLSAGEAADDPDRQSRTRSNRA